MAQCAVIQPYHRGSYEKRWGSSGHMLTIMHSHDYELGSGVFLGHTGIKHTGLQCEGRISS